jgi:hypothetical protein
VRAPKLDAVTEHGVTRRRKSRHRKLCGSRHSELVEEYEPGAMLLVLAPKLPDEPALPSVGEELVTPKGRDRGIAGIIQQQDPVGTFQLPAVDAVIDRTRHAAGDACDAPIDIEARNTEQGVPGVGVFSHVLVIEGTSKATTGPYQPIPRDRNNGDREIPPSLAIVLYHEPTWVRRGF